MRADARTRSRVGIIVFASLVIFAGIIMVIGGKTGFFLARTSYFSRLPNSQGPVESNQGRLAGVTVGSLRKIEGPGRPREGPTPHLGIEKRYPHLLKTGSPLQSK